MTRALVLVDGEHYPPVLLDALEQVEARGYHAVAAVFLGGGEKLAGPLELGTLPIVDGPTQREALERAIAGYQPEVVVDLSDAPVVDQRARFLLASVALARGVAYHGADFRLDPPPRPLLTTRPAVAVIGTGKRTGKTALGAALARRAAATGRRPVIVAMGRGGPAEPVVTRAPPTPAVLLELARRGEHAATDAYEDAVVARVTTVGARRAGAGLAGAPFSHTVAEAVRAADATDPSLVILEGSGTAIPPAAVGATVLAVGAATPASEIAWGLGPYRLLLADLVCVTMAEEPILSGETLAALTSQIHELSRDVPIVRTVFRPTPVGSVAGKKVFFATTAPTAVGQALIRHLEEVHGATVVGCTHRLADRSGLLEELTKAEGTYEVLLTEIKAAAIDVAARAATEVGADVVFCDNLPVATEGDLEGAFDRVVQRAEERATR